MNSQLNFLNKLKDSRSESIQSEIDKFISHDFNYIQNLKQEEISKNIQDFVTKIMFEFVKIWEIPLTSKNSQYGEIIDNFERIVVQSLYNKLFCATKQEKEDDYRFEQLIKLYNFITPKHLDIEKIIIDPITLELSINKLSEINSFRTPKGKSIVVINFCRILSYMVSAGQQSSPTGADEVYPVIVYALLKGNVSKLKSNLNFIKLYRHKNRLESEEDYYYTTLVSAVEFIENLNHTKLNIEEEEFRRICEENRKKELLRQQTLIKIPKTKNSEEIALIASITKSGKEKDVNDSIELFDIKNNVIPKNKVNSSSVYLPRKRGSLNIADGLMNISIDKILNNYYSGDFKDLSMNKVEVLYSDFKTCLKLIEDYKINCSPGQEASQEKKGLGDMNSPSTKLSKSSNEANINLIDI